MSGKTMPSLEAFYAHTKEDAPPELWQSLEEHLMNVAETAATFASAFDAQPWGYAAGLWHDLGKYSPNFQAYLRRNSTDDAHRAEQCERVDHSSAGAQFAVEQLGVAGHLLAYVISGHHAGLLDGIGDGPSLDKRLQKSTPDWRPAATRLPHLRPLNFPPFLADALAKRHSDPRGTAFSMAFFVRMLFSCLVDADFLDTERFMDPSRFASRPRWPEDVMGAMESALNQFMVRLSSNDSPVNREREEVRTACLQAAEQPPGLFSLTVPTGGGKTLSSLAFALRHASLHSLKRIIYVVPFTSIIEQNADVFRRVFQPLVQKELPDPVLEHHSAVQAGEETLESRLASENWDAPLVVTTSIQFFESLFANRARRCRKLHNLACSVVVLDEAQKIPVDFLDPCLRALRELTSHYGTTVVLCTATQPAIHRRPDFPIGLEGVREIIPEPRRLQRALKRTTLEYLGDLTDEALAGRLKEEAQVLCVVNTRDHARKVFHLLKDEPSVLHLSAAMCPAHRSYIIRDIRRLLESKKPCRLIATQLVEAGVDLDFPSVYRSLAGLDSVIQAAGRCNRNGSRQRGTVYLFKSEHPTSERFLSDTTNATVQLLGNRDSSPIYHDLLSLDTVEHYFRLYFWSQKSRWDSRAVLRELSLQNQKEFPFLFGFRTIADRFQLIRDSGKPVIVPWGEEGASLCNELRKSWNVPRLDILRRLQRYTVQIPGKEWDRAVGRSIELVHDRFPLLISAQIHYDSRLGLRLEGSDPCPDAFIL